MTAFAKSPRDCGSPRSCRGCRGSRCRYRCQAERQMPPVPLDTVQNFKHWFTPSWACCCKCVRSCVPYCVQGHDHHCAQGCGCCCLQDHGCYHAWGRVYVHDVVIALTPNSFIVGDHVAFLLYVRWCSWLCVWSRWLEGGVKRDKERERAAAMITMSTKEGRRISIFWESGVPLW